MKVSIDIDCTPEEARAFLGLPDVAPLQEAALAQMKAQLDAAAKAMSPEAVMKTMFPLAPEKMAEMQKAFWANFGKS
jgi:hypothetical protein